MSNEETALEGYRLSPCQTTVWNKQQPHTWWVRGVVRIHGKLDQARLQAAVNGVHQRHDVLRTVLASVPGMRTPLQLDGGPAMQPLEFTNRQSFDPDDSLSWHTLLDPPASELDWQKGPLWRARVVTITDEQHALIIAMPALLADPLSLPLFVGQLADAYRGHPDGEELLPFLEYSEWHQELIESDEREDGIEFWRSGDRNGKRPLPNSTSVAHAIAQWDRDEVLESDAKSLPIQMLTASVVLASRLFNRERPLVYWRLGGRKFTDFAKSIGPFNALLPLQVECKDGMSFADASAEVETALEEAAHWGEFWFCPEVQKDAAHWPAADLAFEYLESVDVAAGDDLRFELAAIRSEASHQCGPRFTFLRRPSGFTVDLALVPPTCADAGRRYLDHYGELLCDALENPNQSISRLRLLNDRWRRTIQFDWNGPDDAEIVQPVTVHQLFEQQVERTPEAVAVTLADQRLTFAELNRRANQLARLLAGQGIGPEVPCTVLLDRCPDMLTAILAIWKCGGCYIPLDPALPDARIEYMLQQAHVPLVVSQRRHVVRLDDTTRDMLCIDENASELSSESALNLDLETDWDNLAYIVFTSGSTGRPKAVSVSHRSVVHLDNGLAQTVYADVSAGECVGLNAPLTFDASVKQILQVTRGCTLAIIPDEVRRDVGDLVDYLTAQQVDVLDLTPSHARLLLSDETAWKALTTKRFVLGGEQLDPATAARLTAASGGMKRSAANVYGPTECTDVATTCEIDQVDQITIGRPLPHARIYVLDRWGESVPPGVTGEIYIGGAGVARGYHNQPALTAERFVPDPFSNVPGARLYRTGDLGRFLSDGRLVFAGRHDRQVKLNGFRVELGEIESTMLRHPNVKSAVVVASNDADGQKQINAYAVGRVPSLHGEGLLELPNGMYVAHQNKNETDYLFEEIFEKESYTKNGIQLHEGMSVLDVGANIGMFTMYVMAACPTAKVIAFEPITAIYDTLRRNLDRFGAQVTVKPFGLASTPREETFTYYPRYSMMSGASEWSRPDDESEVIKQFLANEADHAGANESSVLLEHAAELLAGRFDGEEVTCRLRRLSDVIDEEGMASIDLLKIDVQRAELDVLEGLREDHWQRIMQIVMEVHDASGTESEGRTSDIQELLERHGFDVVIEQDQLLTNTDRYNLYAVRAERAAGVPIRIDGIPTTDLSTDGLRSFLGEELPAYMQPANLILLDELPVNQHGKLDLDQLPSPESLRKRNRTGSPEYRNELEATLAAIWSEVLHTDEVWPEDNFFELGGDSIRSIQLQIAAKKQGITFTLPQFFEHQTVRKLVESLEQASVASESTAPTPTRPFELISPADRELLPPDVQDAFPMSSLARGMHYHTQLRNSGATYHTLIGTDIHCRLDEEHFHRAAEDLAAAHPVFRSAFDFAKYSQPLQIVLPGAPENLVSVCDLRSLDAQAQVDHIRDFVESNRQQPMNLAVPPLLYIHIFHRNDSLFTLIWEDYHGIIDGLSAHLALDELLHRYQLLLGESMRPLPEPPRATYADYIAAEQAALRDTEAIKYWTDKFKDSAAQVIPRENFDRSRPRDMESVSVTIAPSVVERLQGHAKSNSLPLKSLLMAVHLRVMGLIQRTTGPVTGMVTNVRPECLDGDRILGLFINTLPFQLRLGSESWLELARRCYELEREQLPNRRVPMAEICRRLGRRSLFETFFNYSHFHSQTQSEKKSLQDGRWDRTVDIDFTLSVDLEVQSDNSILLQLIYDNHELSREQVDCFAEYVTSGVHAFADNPTASQLESLPIDAHVGSASAVQESRGDTSPLISGSQLQLSPAAEKAISSTPARELATVVAELLDLNEDEVPMESSFEALGGHSLLVAVLCERLREAFGLSLCPAEFVGNPTLADLADRIARLDGDQR